LNLHPLRDGANAGPWQLHSRWEALIAGVIVIVPLLSTGVIPVSARVPIDTPVRAVTIEPIRPVPTGTSRTTGHKDSAPRPTVVLVSNNPNAIHLGDPTNTTTDPTLATPPGPYVGQNHTLTDLTA